MLALLTALCQTMLFLMVLCLMVLFLMVLSQIVLLQGVLCLKALYPRALSHIYASLEQEQQPAQPESEAPPPANHHSRI